MKVRVYATVKEIAEVEIADKFIDLLKDTEHDALENELIYGPILDTFGPNILSIDGIYPIDKYGNEGKVLYKDY